MKLGLFDFTDYKKYLLHRLESQEGLGKGGRTRLCEAMACKTSYLSQILNGHAQLSLEQADMLNHFFGHEDNESDFFLLLVQNDRAGTESLRQHTQKQIKKILARRQRFKNRLPVSQKLTLEQQVKYYSSWHFAAVHMSTTVASLRTPDAIAKRLSLDTGQVARALEFLVTAGLVNKTPQGYGITTQRIHLGDDSDLTAPYHASLRAKAALSTERKRKDDLHYSSVITIAKVDVPKLREHLMKAIESAKKMIRESGSEDVRCLSIDWFAL